MSGKYDDLIDLERPQYPDLPPMPVENRAAQFSPFAAVVGYGDAVEETARFTDSKVSLQEDAVYELNMKMEEIIRDINDHPAIRVTYFVPDRLKAGGRYAEYEGAVKKIDEYNEVLIFEDGTRISMPEITDIRRIEE